MLIPDCRKDGVKWLYYLACPADFPFGICSYFCDEKLGLGSNIFQYSNSYSYILFILEKLFCVSDNKCSFYSRKNFSEKNADTYQKKRNHRRGQKKKK